MIFPKVQRVYKGKKPKCHFTRFRDVWNNSVLWQKKSEGGGEENWVRDTVKALCWPHQRYDVRKNVTALPEIHIQSSFLSAVEGGLKVSQLTLTLHILNFPTSKLKKYSEVKKH